MQRGLLPIAWGVLALLPVVPASAQGGPITARYACADGTHLTAVFTPPATMPGSVALTLPGAGQPVTLPQALSADGGRYAAENLEFWVKGREATYTRGSTSVICRTS
jgi:membrane-bound inhibitor of C-type lysozyme